LEATDDTAFDEKNLVCGAITDNWEFCGECANLQRETVSRDAVEMHWAIPWRANRGNYGSAGTSKPVLYGRSKWRSVEDDGFWEHLDANL
jgi:hypothetical protein